MTKDWREGGPGESGRVRMDAERRGERLHE